MREITPKTLASGHQNRSYNSYDCIVIESGLRASSRRRRINEAAAGSSPADIGENGWPGHPSTTATSALMPAPLRRLGLKAALHKMAGEDDGGRLQLIAKSAT